MLDVGLIVVNVSILYDPQVCTIITVSPSVRPLADPQVCTIITVSPSVRPLAFSENAHNF